MWIIVVTDKNADQHEMEHRYITQSQAVEAIEELKESGSECEYQAVQVESGNSVKSG